MKKQLLFLLTLLLAITPACTKQQKMAAANGAIAAGTISTAAGITSAATFPPAVVSLSAFAGAGITAGGIAFLVIVPAVLIGGGIAAIVKGVQQREKLKQQKLLEKKKFEQEQQTRIQEEKEISHEI